LWSRHIWSRRRRRRSLGSKAKRGRLRLGDSSHHRRRRGARIDNNTSTRRCRLASVGLSWHGSRLGQRTLRTQNNGCRRRQRERHVTQLHSVFVDKTIATACQRRGACRDIRFDNRRRNCSQRSNSRSSSRSCGNSSISSSSSSSRIGIGIGIGIGCVCIGGGRRSGRGDGFRVLIAKVRVDSNRKIATSHSCFAQHAPKEASSVRRQVARLVVTCVTRFAAHFARCWRLHDLCMAIVATVTAARDVCQQHADARERAPALANVSLAALVAHRATRHSWRARKRNKIQIDIDLNLKF
jgi:hypothetical protein